MDQVSHWHKRLLAPAMPGSTLNMMGAATTSSTSVLGSSVQRGGLESSLILNRISAGLGLNRDAYSSAPGMDTALLALELKRHERKRNLLRYRSRKSDDELQPDQDQAKYYEDQFFYISTFKSIMFTRNDKQLERARRVNEVRERMADKRATYFNKELDQWLKKMKCSGATGQKLENFRDIKVILYWMHSNSRPKSVNNAHTRSSRWASWTRAWTLEPDP